MAMKGLLVPQSHHPAAGPRELGQAVRTLPLFLGRSPRHVRLQLPPGRSPRAEAARPGSVSSFSLEAGLELPGASCTQSQASCLLALALLTLLLKHGAPGKVCLLRLNDRPGSLSSVRDGAGPIRGRGITAESFMDKTRRGSFYSNLKAHSGTVLYGGFSMPSVGTDSPSLAAASSGPL